MSSCILRSWEFGRAYWLYCLANNNNDNDMRIAFHQKMELDRIHNVVRRIR